MEITGEILTIIYKNEVNSYTVAEFETDEEYIECKAVCRLHQGVEPHLEQ